MKTTLATLCAALLIGCTPTGPGTEKLTDSLTKTVGEAGGTLEVNGALLEIPAGALTADTEITLGKSSTVPPSNYTPQSAVYDLLPSGLVFATAASLTLEFTGDGAALSMFLTAKSGPGFEKIAGTVTALKVKAPIGHFSIAFAGQQGPLPLSDVSAAYVQMVCHLETVCGVASSTERCTALITAAVTDGAVSGLGAAAPAVASGRQRYDGAKAQACVDAIAALTTCPPNPDAYLATVPDCHDALVGAVQQGGSCYLDPDCVTGNYCAVSASNCPGSCQARVAVGQVLPSGAQCVDGAGDYNGICFKSPKAGESCAPISPVTKNQTCADGAFCSTSNTTCVARRGVDEVCTTRSECAAGLYCDQPSGASVPGACKKLVGQGGACSSQPSVPCTVDLTCLPNAAGATAGTCVPLRASGESCFYPQCDRGLYCPGSLQQAGACTAHKAVNDACVGDLECGPQRACVGTPSKTCQTRKVVGASCVAANECVSGAYCSSGTCVRQTCTAP